MLKKLLDPFLDPFAVSFIAALAIFVSIAAIVRLFIVGAHP